MYADLCCGETVIPTHYTDKIDATVSTNIPDVTKQTADHQSVLNTYLIFTALRNTYPALAQGTMTRHALFNESGEGEKKIQKYCRLVHD